MILTPKQEQNFFDKVLIIPGGCHEWMGAIHSGYGRVCLKGDLKGAHQVAWAMKHGRWALGYVLHKCDNKRCVNPDHLYEGSPSDNMIDKAQRGPLTTQQKLTPDDVREIRRLLFLGCYTQAEIAQRFGVTRKAISKINTGMCWNHVS